MKAKIVTVSFATRVEVKDSATVEEIVAAAKQKIKEKFESEFAENLESIIDDTEQPG